MKPLVAGVVVEYRAPSHTAKCVQTLLSQGVEKIFVVDNSDDNGATYALLGDLLSNDPRIWLELAEENLGFAAGVNLGLSLARANSAADRILIINNDAVPEPGLVASLANALDSDPRRLIAYPSLLHAGTRMHEVYYNRWVATVAEQPGYGAFRVPRGCCMMVAVDRLPGPLFDESFFMYGEEIALGWDLRDQPEALCWVPDALAVHEGSVGSKIGSPFYEHRTAAAHLLLTHRLARSAGQRVLLGLIRTPAILLRATVRAVKARSWVPLIALYQAHRTTNAACKRKASN